MRQAGLKPKNHSSGVYWVRASSGNSTGGKQEENEGLGVIGFLFLIIISPIWIPLILIDRLIK